MSPRPPSARRSCSRPRYQGIYSLAGNTGAWLKERRGDVSYAVNVLSIDRNGTLKNPRIFEFDGNGYISTQITAGSARIGDGHWMLTDVEEQKYDTRGAADQARIATTKIPQLNWATSLTSEMVSVALLRPDRMSTIDLFDYIRHLDANGQTAQRYEIEFWRKVFYPLSCLVMVVLALPFAYLHFRQAGITTYVFGGVMIGISFFLLNNVFGYLGNLSNWSPWLTAAAPGMIYSVMSLTAFSWLVLATMTPGHRFTGARFARRALARAHRSRGRTRVRQRAECPRGLRLHGAGNARPATAVAALIASGATAIRVVPLFLGMGKHAREDLPRQLEALRQRWPDIGFSLARIVGEEPELVDLLARIAVK